LLQYSILTDQYAIHSPILQITIYEIRHFNLITELLTFT